MNKLFIISDLTGGPGGAYTYIKQIESFQSNQFDLTIVLDLYKKDEIQKQYNFKNVKYLPLSLKYHDIKQINESMDLFIEDNKYSLFHFVNGSMKSNIIWREKFGEKNIPFIVTEQYISRNLDYSETIFSKLEFIHSKTFKTIFVSKANEKLAKNQFKFNSLNTLTIPNSTITSLYKKDHFNKTPNKFFTLGRCVHQKGLDIVIKALSLISDYNITFHVIGGGNEDDLFYRNLSKDLLSSNIDFEIIPWSNQINLIELAQTYDLYISASRDEGLSFSLLEVTTLGFPIICSDCSGNTELIEENERGHLFPNEDYFQLSNEIVSFIDNPVPLVNMARNNTSVTDSKFGLNTSMKRLEKIYNNLNQK